VHAQTGLGEVVAQLVGVHVLDIGSAVTLYLDPHEAYVFDAAGELLAAPGDLR
jgi:glycerol transport system ATP-binding protein